MVTQVAADAFVGSLPSVMTIKSSSCSGKRLSRYEETPLIFAMCEPPETRCLSSKVFPQLSTFGAGRCTFPGGAGGAKVCDMSGAAWEGLVVKTRPCYRINSTYPCGCMLILAPSEATVEAAHTQSVVIDWTSQIEGLYKESVCYSGRTPISVQVNSRVKVHDRSHTDCDAISWRSESRCTPVCQASALSETRFFMPKYWLARCEDQVKADLESQGS
ncbi:hypothetical protein KCU70_g211, partial [Aureobasidium melanogenum]